MTDFLISDPQSPDPQAADALAGEYVLGTLPHAARLRVEARLAANDAVLRDAITRWEARLLPLAALAEPITPSAAVWARITGSVNAVDAADAVEAPLSDAARALAIAAYATSSALPPPAATAEEEPAWRARPAAAPASSSSRAAPPPVGGWHRLWESMALWRGLAGAGFVAAAVMATVLLGMPGLLPARSQYLVVLVAPANQSAGWVVQAKSAGQLELVPVGAAAGNALPADKSLQFWTKAEGWTKPVSLGLITPGQPVRVPLDQLPPLQPNQLFELTIEPANGSPTNLPTGPIQFIGRAVKVST